MDFENALSSLSDGKLLLSVQGTPVPAPPGADHPGNHLYVNCLYNSDVARQSPEAILATARADTLRVLVFLVGNQLLSDFVSLCISFFCRDGTNQCRLYRYSVLASSISPNGGSLNESYFSSFNDSIESSQIDAISSIILTKPQ